MKDFYQALGLNQEASLKDVKKAYRNLAMSVHPDKGGDAAMMAFINEAYETLSDPAKRSDFDERWAAFRATETEREETTEIAGNILPGDTPPYSQTFRNQHREFVLQFQQTPQRKASVHDFFTPFATEVYSLVEGESERKITTDIFTLIRMKSERHMQDSMVAPQESLHPLMAIKILTHFLAGNYYGEQLGQLQRYLIIEVGRLKTAQMPPRELSLYEGICEIVALASETYVASGIPGDLLLSIKKITDFAKQADDAALPYLLPLFYNKYFRSLFAYALHLYWHSFDCFAPECLQQFDGRIETKKLLDVLRERLSHVGETHAGLVKLVQHVKLLFELEKDLHAVVDDPDRAEQYREKAFHILDWLPAILDSAGGQITLNMFLQIGVLLQRASRLEINPAIKMADEKLALKMYLTAVSIANHLTPDIEMYANTHVLRYIAAFQFQEDFLAEVVPALQRRTLTIVDIFPFFEAQRANIAFLQHEDRSLHLMRKLLNAMINALEYNKTHAQGIIVDHSASTVLYQAYEACLKNWYQEQHDSETEQKFRRQLMEELLFENSWSQVDINRNLLDPWVMVSRDDEGWLRMSSRSLPYADSVNIVKYRSIKGAELNHASGKITFFLEPWNPNHSVHERVFTIFDLQEMLEKNLAGAIFSLDPVDPDKPYHPFNVMRFAPSQLYHSELLNTMLLTDYILKFLTTNQEVQGRYPYEQRPIDQMISHLPAYLRAIIEDFHREQHSGATHRFWIEAEEINVALPNGERKADVLRIGLGRIRMVVKKHRMERDIHGELKDVGDEDEGWPIYVLKRPQIQELLCGRRMIAGHAMVFVDGETTLHFWENNHIVRTCHPAEPIEVCESLIRLYKQPRTASGQVTVSSKNKHLLYRITKQMTKQNGLPHRYSPEFIFAHEFTTHYDEFAQYLPEFGRLKELSKISVLVRILDNIRASNEEHRQAINYLIGSRSLPAPTTAVYKEYEKGYQRVHQNVTESFAKWRQELNRGELQRKHAEQLSKIRDKIGTLTFDPYSREVNAAIPHMYDEVARDNPGAPRWRVEEAVNGRRSDIAQQLSSLKRQDVFKQLLEVFSAQLEASVGIDALRRMINDFMWGNPQSLAEALVNHDWEDAKSQIHQQFKHVSLREIGEALDGSMAATNRIANEEACQQLRQVQQEKDKIEAGFMCVRLGKYATPISLKGTCFWVPSSVHHEVAPPESMFARHSFFVYGGVQIQPQINTVPGGGALGGSAVDSAAFDKVYRVYGDSAGAYGHSWTTTNPGSVSDFRNQAGLPDQNTGRFVIEGRLVDTCGVSSRDALPLHGNVGGAPEIIVPNPQVQIIIERVSGVNPPF